MVPTEKTGRGCGQAGVRAQGCLVAREGGLGANQADIFPAKYTGQVLVMGSEVN